MRQVSIKLFPVALSALLFAGCSSDTGGGGENLDGSGFVNEDGGISIELNEENVGVGDITGFRVRVRDAQGIPVPSIQIACDTEGGLALTEPTTGFELTDGNGDMSGKLGCIQPGSYQVGCRLPVGANKRDFKTVICEGPIPAGFTGFPGAGGGTLGVGSPTGGNAPGSGAAEVSVSSVSVIDDGASGATSTIDVYRNTCAAKDTNGDGDTTDACDLALEPFFDSKVQFSLTNGAAESITFNSFRYSVSGSNGSGVSFQSNSLGFISGGALPANGTATVQGLFLKAVGGSSADTCASIGAGARKVFSGSSSPISLSTGFRNVTFTLSGTGASGQAVTAQATVGVSFGSYDRCS